MKNIKLNKLAENRLQEKEMRSLIGGGSKEEWNVVYNKDFSCSCIGLCSCNDFLIPGTIPRVANVVSATGVGSVTIARDVNCIV